MRILLLEDDDLLRSLSMRTLTTLGHEVLEASTTVEAQRWLDARDSGVDLLFADARLGGGPSEGIEFAQLALATHSSLRVVLTSGDPAGITAAMLKDPRIRALAKPYRKDQLAETLGSFDN
jgi:DNA-binding NtrC family response regulator